MEPAAAAHGSGGSLPTESFVVPYTRWEWLTVRQVLLAITRNERISAEILVVARNILECWSTRSRAPNPVGQLTEHVVRAYLMLARKDETSSDGSECGTIGMAIAYAIVAFASLSHEVTQSHNTCSMMRAASLIGLPNWIVSLRHEIAHNCQLPPLHQLVEGLRQAANYIYFACWNRTFPEAIQSQLENGEDDADDQPSTTSRLSDPREAERISGHTLRLYVRCVERKQTPQEPVLARLDKLLSSAPIACLRKALGAGYLILTDRQLFGYGINLEGEFKIPVAVQDVWQPFFRLVGSKDLLFDLIEMIIVELSSGRSSRENIQLVAWLNLFLEAQLALELGNDEAARARNVARWNHAQRRLYSISDKIACYADIQRRCEQSSSVKRAVDPFQTFQRFSPVGPSSDESTSSAPSSSSAGNSIRRLLSARFAHSLRNATATVRGKVVDAPQLPERRGCVREAEAHDWAMLPFGCAPGQTAESLCLYINLPDSMTEHTGLDSADSIEVITIDSESEESDDEEEEEQED